METLENNPEEHIETAPSRWSGLSTRAASAAVLALIFLLVLWKGGWIFTWFIMMSALMMMREWNGLTEHEGSLWRFSGLFYVSIPCASAVWLRNVDFATLPEAGMWLVLYLIVIVSVTDIGAYFAGRHFGGPRLAPIVSPNKTWAGLGGGMAAAALAGGLCHFFTPYPVQLVPCMIFGMVLAVIAQAGDLFESWMKRNANVKDSGTLIPGHGGLLDRIDGLTFTLPIFAAAVALSGYVM